MPRRSGAYARLRHTSTGARKPSPVGGNLEGLRGLAKPHLSAGRKAMFPGTSLAPAGGIEIDDIASCLRAGAAFVGVGRGLADTKTLCTGDKDATIDAAANALDQATGARALSHNRKR